MSKRRKQKRQARKAKYKFRNFLFDIVLTCLTGGLWLIWIFVREMRKK